MSWKRCCCWKGDGVVLIASWKSASRLGCVRMNSNFGGKGEGLRKVVHAEALRPRMLFSTTTLDYKTKAATFQPQRNEAPSLTTMQTRVSL
eukprot:5526651-Amphidinium_carterae.1